MQSSGAILRKKMMTLEVGGWSGKVPNKSNPRVGVACGVGMCEESKKVGRHGERQGGRAEGSL